MQEKNRLPAWARTLLYGAAAFLLARSHHLNWLDDVLRNGMRCPRPPFGCC